MGLWRGAAGLALLFLTLGPVRADEAEQLLGPEALDVGVRRVIDDSAQGDTSGGAIKGGLEGGMSDRMGGGGASSDTDAVFPQLLQAPQRAASDQADAQDTDGSGSGDGDGGDGAGGGANRNPLSTVGQGIKVDVDADIDVDLGAKVDLALKPGAGGDPKDVSSRVPDEDPADHIARARVTVENAISQAGLDPKSKAIAPLMKILNPSFPKMVVDLRNKGAIGTGDTPAAQRDDLNKVLAGINTGDIADRISNAASRSGSGSGVVPPSGAGSGIVGPQMNIDTDPGSMPMDTGDGGDDGGMPSIPGVPAVNVDVDNNALQPPNQDMPFDGQQANQEDFSVPTTDEGGITPPSPDDDGIDKIADATSGARADQGAGVTGGAGVDNQDGEKGSVQDAIEKASIVLGKLETTSQSLSKIGTDARAAASGSGGGSGVPGVSIDVDALRKKVADAVPSQDIENMVNNAVKTKVSDSVAGLVKRTTLALDNVEKTIVQKTNDAFAQIQSQITPQINAAVQDYQAKQNTANAITVPPIKYDTKNVNCHKMRKWHWPWSKVCDQVKTPNAKSLQDHESAQSRKDVAQGQADAANTLVKAWVGASTEVSAQQKTSIDSIHKAFNGARSTMVSVSVDPMKATDAVSGEAGGDGGSTPLLGSSAGSSSVASTSDRDRAWEDGAGGADGRGGSSGQRGTLTLTGSLVETIMADDVIAASIGNLSEVREFIGGVGRTDGIADSIQGMVTMTVGAGGSVDAAIGDESRAALDLGGLEASTLSSVLETVTAVGAVNAAIGERSVAVLDVGVTRGNLGGNETLIADATGVVNASIGADTLAAFHQGTVDVGTEQRPSHGVFLEADAPVAVNAAIGNDSESNLLIGNVDGTLDAALTQKVTAAGAISAAIGDRSTSVLSVGNVSGKIGGPQKNTVRVVGAVSAAIGERTTASVAIGNIGSDAEIHASGTMNVDVAGAVAAAIGYNSESTISVGNIRAPIKGTSKMDIVTGPLIAASLGATTMASIAVGDVNQPIYGNYDSRIRAGDITVFSIGGNARSEVYVGVIDAPVHGNVDLDINTAAIFTGALGANNRAITHVGYVEARDDGSALPGNVDIDVTVGEITNFSIGVGAGGDSVDSRVSVGSILSDSTVNGEARVQQNTGGVNAFSLGFTFDVPLLGTYFIGERGCRSLGDIGSPGCSNRDNRITIDKIN